VFKLFTLEGATRMLPVVEARLQELEDAVRELREAQARVAGADLDPVEAQAARQELAFLVGAAHDARREVERLGVQVPDLETGIVEFPSRVGGEIVHLVWERGDAAITHYHRLTGDAVPRPLASADPVDGDGRPERDGA
jgi:hypothetical protein